MRVTRKLREAADEGAGQPDRMIITPPLTFLVQLAEAVERPEATAFWKPAFDAGIVSLLTDLLTEPLPTINLVLRISAHFLVAAPRGGVDLWAGGLPRAIAGLILARPPVVPGAAIVTLLDIGLVRGEVIRDFHRWGVTAEVQRLMIEQSNPNLMVAAARLWFVVQQEPTVSSSLLPCSHTSIFFYKPTVLPFVCTLGIHVSTICPKCTCDCGTVINVESVHLIMRMTK